jgi:hypothetical protein
MIGLFVTCELHVGLLLLLLFFVLSVAALRFLFGKYFFSYFSNLEILKFSFPPPLYYFSRNHAKRLVQPTKGRAGGRAGVPQGRA